MNPDQIATIAAYNKSAALYASKIAKLDNYNFCYDYLLTQLAPGDSVLDLACGPGNVAKYLCARQSLHITGFDLAPAMLELARINIPSGTFVEQSIINFTVSQKFTLVLNAFGLPYLNTEQRASCFASMYNATKPGGMIFLSFMEGDKQGYEKVSYNPDELFYIHYHMRNDVIRDLENAGFRIEQQWVIPYQEADGSMTNDIVLVAKS